MTVKSLSGMYKNIKQFSSSCFQDDLIVFIIILLLSTADKLFKRMFSWLWRCYFIMLNRRTAENLKKNAIKSCLNFNSKFLINHNSSIDIFKYDDFEYKEEFK